MAMRRERKRFQVGTTGSTIDLMLREDEDSKLSRVIGVSGYVLEGTMSKGNGKEKITKFKVPSIQYIFIQQTDENKEHLKLKKKKMGSGCTPLKTINIQVLFKAMKGSVTTPGN